MAKKVAGTLTLPPVQDGEEPWTKEEVGELRGELDRMVTELSAEISDAERAWKALQHDVGEGAGDDQADTGANTSEREQELSLAANSRELLAQTERAIERLVNGHYGICESCGNPIAKARLQAFPRATLCVTCKAKEERR